MTITINTKKYEPHVSNTLTEKQITTHGDKESGPALGFTKRRKGNFAFSNITNLSLQKKKKPTFSHFLPPTFEAQPCERIISSLLFPTLTRNVYLSTTRGTPSIPFFYFFLFFPSFLFSTEVATSFSPFLRSFFILLITCSFFSFH